MNTWQKVLRTLPSAGLISALSACSAGGDGSANVDDSGGMVVSAPPILLNARNVNRNALSPTVRLNDGTVIPMSLDENNAWRGQVQVDPNTTYVLTIEWNEQLSTGPLILASLSQEVFVGADGEVVQNVAASAYSTQHDDDLDSFTNLQEREFGSNPTSDASVPSNPSTESDNNPSDPDPDPNTSNGNANGNNSDELGGATVVIPRVAADNAPDIDGLGVVELASDGSLLGEWSDAVQFDVNGALLGINNLMIDAGVNEDNGDPHRRWAALHDGERMYILVLVDDVGLRFGDSGDEVWSDDAVELFIDADNSKNLVWGDNDDFQFLIPGVTPNGDANNNLTSAAAANSRFLVGIQASTVDVDIRFATGPGIGPDGIRQPRFEQDVYEISFDLDDAGIELGEPFGFELQVDDDDNGDDRDAKWGWFHPARDDVDTDLTFVNPSIMGTVILGQ